MVCFISQDILFWTFSTIIQSMVAFVALLGMVAVYKIQTIERNKENIAESMRGYLVKNWREEVSGYSFEEIIKEIHDLPKDSQSVLYNNRILKNTSLRLSKKDKYLINIKGIINDFFLLTISLISFSLILLPMSSYLGCNEYSLPILVIIILWSTSALYLGYRLVKKLI